MGNNILKQTKQPYYVACIAQYADGFPTTSTLCNGQEQWYVFKSSLALF